MYCPNCGRSNEVGHRYCRNCGLNLEAVSASLAAQLRSGNIEPGDRRLELLGNVAFGGLGLVVMAGVSALIYTIVTGLILSGKGVVFGVFAMAFIAFAVLALGYIYMSESKKDKGMRQARPGPEPSLGDADTVRLLDAGKFEPVSSVVDDTTELLKVEAGTRML